MKKTLLYTSLGALFFYLLLCTALFIFQNKILFPARHASQIEYQTMREKLPNSKWEFKTKDNVTLKGWFVDLNPDKPIYIYYGGNAEDITSTFRSVLNTIDRSLLSVNYRSYGESGGQPSEKELFSDALEIFDVIQNKYKDRTISLIGRSLGSGVACYVASSRKVGSLTLITPYDSVLAVAKKKYSLAPVGLLLQHTFNSIKYSKKINVPTLFLLAEYDGVIPRENSMVLFDQWTAQKVLHIVPHSNHNSMIIGTANQFKLTPYFKEFMLKTE